MYSSLTLEDLTDLESVQKYIEDYTSGRLSRLFLSIGSNWAGLPVLKKRKTLSVIYKKCLKSPNIQVKNIFPLNKAQSTIDTRKPEKYHVNMARTNRYKKSAVPYMQRLLNNENEK